ncbi:MULTISPECIES: hypothetical protein [Thalassospira]|uniref:Uncharacterized protein n=1 Tax=Thalassospira profundimaris TaxID=502049 RepID=A0A367VJN0_9PROT|nr:MULTISPECIES: hypothetical protein [Thalassospira]KZB70933.1 hypothetical protein AUQ43_08780 [Thalassospira sp. MCCC 1A01148]MBR9899348.1 hypothetical protein [Rhodospirillales bacterium]RCK25425.1 hypothetical protein TH6_02075 [Thalassospira profundimaris]
MTVYERPDDQLPVLLASRDPGAANTLVAFLKIYTSNNFPDLRGRLDGVLKNHSLPPMQLAKFHVLIWQSSVWAFNEGSSKCFEKSRIEIDQVGNEKSLEAEIEFAKNVVDRIRPELLITGLDDVDAVRVRALWAQARANNVPIICLADVNFNINIRLKDIKGEDFIPHLLIVPTSTESRSASAHEVFKTQRVVFFDQLHEATLDTDDSRSMDCREAWAVGKDATVILYPSLVGRELRGKGRNVEFDEVLTAERLARLIGEGKMDELGVTDQIKNPHLIIRPHPRENAGKYSYMLEKEFGVLISVSDFGSAKDAMLSADYIIGLPGGFIAEARLRGCHVISI